VFAQLGFMDEQRTVEARSLLNTPREARFR
jgi:hypothetical protein